MAPEFDKAFLPRTMLCVALCLTSTVLVSQVVAGKLDLHYLDALSPFYVALCIWILYFWTLAFTDACDAIGIIIAATIGIGMLLATALLVGAKVDGLIDSTTWHVVFSMIYLIGLAGALGCCCGIVPTLVGLWVTLNPSFLEGFVYAVEYLGAELVLATGVICPATFAFLLARNLEAADAAGLSILDPSAQPLLTSWTNVFAPIIFLLVEAFVGWAAAGCVFTWTIYYPLSEPIEDKDEWDTALGYGFARQRATRCMPRRSVACVPFVVSHIFYMLGLLGTMTVFVALVIVYLNNGGSGVVFGVAHMFDALIAFWAFLLFMLCVKPFDRRFCGPSPGRFIPAKTKGTTKPATRGAGSDHSASSRSGAEEGRSGAGSEGERDSSAVSSRNDSSV